MGRRKTFDPQSGKSVIMFSTRMLLSGGSRLFPHQPKHFLLSQNARNFSVIAGTGINADGLPELDLDQSSPVLESTPITNPRVRILTLNRPKTLNALNLEMGSTLAQRLKRLNKQGDQIDCVVIQGNGRGFCSGGDLKELYENRNDSLFAENYFRTVYTLNYVLKSTLGVGLVSILDGVAMGGGMGIAMGSRYRVATENTIVAMPEVNIGLHPDTGMSYWGSRLKGNYGQYLATGVRIDGREAVERNIATHFVQSQNIPLLLERIAVINSDRPHQSMKAILDDFTEYSADGKEEERKKKAEIIEKCFAEGSARDILYKVLREMRLQDAARMMKCACPLSMELAVESLRRGKSADIKECIQADYRLSVRLVRDSDFFEGIRAMVIDKDRTPRWSTSFDELSSMNVQRFFDPFRKEENCAELDI